jgi:hypothetical protein
MLAVLTFMHILSREMLATIGLPGFVSEYLRLYGFALAFALLVAVGFFIRRLPGWFRSMRAASWPMAQGTIEGVKVNVVSGQALGELAYSYIAEGERYSGYFLLQFANEQDAWDWVTPLKGQSIWVRYETGNPPFSAVRSEDQSFLFANKHGNLITKLLTRHVVEIMDLSAWKDWANSLRAGNWPIIKGRVEYEAVTQHRDTETWLLFPNYTAEVSYSYSVAGEYYSGHIERSFFREASAQRFVDNLKGKAVFVRYNQSSPEMSVLRKSDQPVLQHA